MFSAVLFSPDRVTSRAIEQAAVASEDVCIYKTMHVFPSSYELTRLLNTFQPDILFVDLDQLEEALLLVRSTRVICPDVAVIGFNQHAEKEEAKQALRVEMIEVLPTPVTGENFRQVVAEAVPKARPAVQDNLLAFLPAKAGSGATTVAMNLAGCLANDLDQKVLIIEADLRSGLISVLLKCSAEYSVVDALENASLLDGTLWSRIAVKAHGLDVLASPRPKKPMVVSWTNYHRLLHFVRARYDTIVVDLPEVIDDATIEIVRRAKSAYIVTTPELPSLVLARQRRLEMVARGMPEDRIGVILNRWTKSEIKVEDVEQFLDGPVSAVLQNDYHCVRRAIQEGRLIGRKSELGRAYSALAVKLAGAPAQAKSIPSFLGSLISH